jgi:hypothetical protein
MTMTVSNIDNEVKPDNTVRLKTNRNVGIKKDILLDNELYEA